MTRQTVKFASCALLAASAEAFAQPAQEPETKAAESPTWTLAVVKLQYADADEVAHLLSQVLPASVSVVPYPPTNSVIIAGDSAIVAELAKDDAERREGRP